MDALRRLPLFVLPTVLFPGALLPLHVFEPRYRQMAARCLETDKRFGVLYHDGERWGPFALREGGIGCVAEIVRFQPLPDGRSLLLTQGLERFRIVDGIESEASYAEALVEDFGDTAAEAEDLPARRRVTIELFVAALLRLQPPSEAAPVVDARRDVSFPIAGTFHIAAGWRQQLLEIDSETARLEEIDRVLRSVMRGA
jgi:Lon protease-like protein